MTNTTQKDGGSAFPIPFADLKSPGMSLRDYFAGQALAGDMSSQNSDTGEWPTHMADDLAQRCYAIADAMLAKRNLNRE